MQLEIAQYALGALSGALVGLTLGLFGGGGSILAVPLMVYVVGVSDPHVKGADPVAPSVRRADETDDAASKAFCSCLPKQHAPIEISSSYVPRCP